MRLPLPRLRLLVLALCLADRAGGAAAARHRRSRRRRSRCRRRKGETVALDDASRQGRLRRLLGVVVRSVPPLVPVDERDAPQVRRQGLHDRRDQRRQEARRRRAVPGADAGGIHRRLRRARRDAGRLRGEGHAELVSRSTPTGKVVAVEQGFRDERKAALEQRIRALHRRDDARCASHCDSLLALAAIASAGCATFDPPKPWEKGELARPEMQFDPDPLDAKTTAAHLHEQGRRDRRLRRRRRRLWLQLKAPATPRRRAVARGRCSPRRSRCPASLPARALAQTAPDHGIISLRYFDYRDWQPGARPDDGATVRRCTC